MAMGKCGRAVALGRDSRETEIAVYLDPDAGSGGSIEVSTGIGFLDHMFRSLATHARWSLTLVCRGDLHVDEHHSAEDCALVLGEALKRCAARTAEAGGRIVRFGTAFAPMDDALARVCVDIAGRPWAEVHLGLARVAVGDLSAEVAEHVFRSLATAAGMNLHLDVLRGLNDHHRIEAAFKALALALSQALAEVRPEGSGCSGDGSAGAGGAGAEGEGGSGGKGGFVSAKGAVSLVELPFEAFESRFRSLSAREAGR